MNGNNFFTMREEEYKNHVPSKNNIHLFWDDLPYEIDSADKYLARKGLSAEEIEKFIEQKYYVYEKIDQVIGLLMSRYLFGHTRGGCAQEQMDYMLDLYHEIINQVKEKYDYEIDSKMIIKSDKWENLQ